MSEIAEMPKKLQQVLFEYDRVNAKKFMEALDLLHHLDRYKVFEFVVPQRDLYMAFELIKSADVFPTVKYCYEIEDTITTGVPFTVVSPVLKDGQVAKAEVRLIGDIVHTKTSNIFGRRGYTFQWLKEILSYDRVAELNMNFDFASINDGGQTEKS